MKRNVMLIVAMCMVSALTEVDNAGKRHNANASERRICPNFFMHEDLRDMQRYT